MCTGTNTGAAVACRMHELRWPPTKGDPLLYVQRTLLSTWEICDVICAAPALPTLHEFLDIWIF